MRQEVADAQRQRGRASLAACPLPKPSNSAKAFSAGLDAQQACTRQWNAANPETEAEAITANYNQRLAQVKKDYEAAGCY